MGPRLLARPVLGLQRDAVSGSRSLADPNFKLQPFLAQTLGQAHLTRLRGSEGAKTRERC